MTATQDTNTQQDAPDIRAILQAADNGETIQAPAQPAPPQDPPPDATPDPAPAPDAPEPKPEGEPEGKPESKYVRAKKEAERRDRSWKALEAEKEAFRREREEFERARQQSAPQQSQTQEPARSEPQAQSPGAKDADGFSARDYEEYAEKAEDPREVREALRRAHALRASESKTNLQRAQQESIDRAIKETPELADEKSPLAMKVRDLLGRVKVFGAIPDGFERAVEVAQALLGSERAQTAEARVKELEEELSKLRGAVQPSSGNPGGAPPPKKNILDLPDQERASEVRKLVERFDEATFNR